MGDDFNVTGQIDVKLDESSSDSRLANSAEPEDKTADAAATALATGLTLLTAGLGVFGGLTGAVARMARNYQGQTAWAVSLVLASVVLALASRLVRSTTMLGPARVYRALLWAALLCFVGGVGLAMWTLNDSLGDADRPSIATQTTRNDSGTVTIAGTARAGGLEADEQVYVYLVALSNNGSSSEQVYYSLVGPNQDGLVDHAFSVMLDPGVDAVVVTVGREGLDKACTPPEPPVNESADPSLRPEAAEPPNELTACALVSIGETPPT